MSLLLRGHKEHFEIEERGRRSSRGSVRERERVREGREVESGQRLRAERAVLRARDPEALRAMRRLLFRGGLRVHELRDVEVRAECLRRLRRGELELRVLIPAAFITIEAEEQPALEPLWDEPIAPAPAPRSEPPPAPEVPEPSPGLPWRGDAAAQAQALIEAAQTGEAFCEICAQAEAARARAEEEPVLSPAAEAAQIQALVEASRDGAPFCEICEAAAAERERRAAEASQGERSGVSGAPAAATELAVEQIHAAEQAQTLQAAAERGVPFCELCERGAG